MSNKKLCVLLAIGFLVAGSAFAQNLRPFTALRVLETDHFRIIFPEESRRSAETLASFADATYERLALLLGSQVAGRIPVTITPHTDVFNGYMNPLPYPHIVLYDTPLDVEWTTYRHSLEGLFVHELTHAISMTSRGPFFDFLHGIFGGWVLPASLNAPLFMVEGVTVSFESLEGFGRANDPRVKQRIRQAIHEGTFLAPFQATGVYDKPPLGNAYYEYGGLFSAYLQRRFGMEAYAEFWKELGTRVPLTLVFNRRFFSNVFREVYGVDFLTAWADFAASLAVSGLEENADRVTGGESIIEAVAAGGGRVFVLDRVALAVSAVDPAGRARRVVGTDATAYDLDVSSEGDRLIVAGYRFQGELGTAVAEEYEAASGRRTGRSWRGLYKPRYFRDGVVGLASDLHDNRLVYRDGAGTERVLLAGNEVRMFSAPAPLDEDRVAFIVAERGIRRIGVYDFRTGAAALFGTDVADDGNRWRYARDLRASAGKLYFAYDHDDRFSKLACIEGDAAEPVALFTERDFSGGVYAPVEAGGAIYYRGAFSTWDALMRYPEKAGNLSGVRASLRLTPWPESGSAPAAAVPPAASASAVSGAATGAAPVGPVGPVVSAGDAELPSTREKAYAGLAYLNPFKLWLPLPLLRMDPETFRLDGGGAAFYLSTPTDANTLLLNAGGDGRERMAYFDLRWASLSFPLPLTINASDKIEFDSGEGFDAPYRATRVSGQLSWTRGLPLRGFGGERLRLTVAPGAEAVWVAPEEAGAETAYDWNYLDGEYAAGLAVGLSTFERLPWRLFGRGAMLTGRYRRAFPSHEERFEGIFRAAAENAVPLRATFYGAWDEGGQDLDGHTARYGNAAFAAASVTEYANETRSDLRWVAGGELELRVATLELQRYVSCFYLNRLFGVLAWRGAVYDAEGGADLPGVAFGADSAFVHSAVVKAGAVASILPAGSVPLRFSPFFWAALKLSNLGGEPGDDVAFGFSFAVEW